MAHPDANDPGNAGSDPARRPGQPGVERGQAVDTPVSPAPARAVRFDERQIPLDRIRRDAASAGGAAASTPDPAPLSDGSVKAGPV